MGLGRSRSINRGKWPSVSSVWGLSCPYAGGPHLKTFRSPQKVDIRERNGTHEKLSYKMISVLASQVVKFSSRGHKGSGARLCPHQKAGENQDRDLRGEAGVPRRQ